MPNEILSKGKLRELRTLKRINTTFDSAKILRSFFEKGFKSYDSLSAIVFNYYPEMSENRLWDFWHFRKIDEDICEKLTDVFDKLNNE